MRVGVVGHGTVGRRVVRQLAGTAHVDEAVVASREAPRLDGIRAARPGSLEDVFGSDVVVVATAVPHHDLVEQALRHGAHVVSTSDDREDVDRMARLHGLAHRLGRTVVVGAAAAPGLSGLLARYGAGLLDVVDEIHVQAHGAGGPSCARQHHHALGGLAVSWHDGEWRWSPAGTGRELCWFPDPIGAHDCYRADLVDPILLHEAFPSSSRVSARLSATRRDRLTARLPMLRRPHPEGLVGAVRVELRGAADGRREVVILGVAAPLAVIAGAVAAVAALAAAAGRLACGSVALADPGIPAHDLLADLHRRGIVAKAYDPTLITTLGSKSVMK